MKKLVALALGTVMAVSMTAGVSAATVESKDDLKNATIGVQLGTTGDIEASEYEADGATVKRNIINLRKKWKGICSQVPFIVLKYRQGCI